MDNFFSSLIYILEANIVLFICQIFTIFIVLKLIVDKKSASNILAWLLAILFIPYVAIPFFFIFQRKDRRKFWQKGAMNIHDSLLFDEYCINNKNCENLPTSVISTFENLELSTLTRKNSFDIYTDGIKSFETFINAIKAAKKSIYIQTYIIKSDKTSKLVIKALEKKAAEGLDIKLMIDSLGSFYIYRHNKRIFKNLRKLGAEVVFFMPVISNPIRNYINYRNHRKIFIFDNETVLSGGMNIGDEYMSPIHHDGMWNDLLFKIQGESIVHFLKVFCSDWHFATDEELSFKIQNNVREDCFVQVIPSGPDMHKNQLYAGLIAAINSAQRNIYIQTYVFKNDTTSKLVINALEKKAADGVEIKLLIDSLGSFYVYRHQRKIFKKLRNLGAKVVFFMPVISNPLRNYINFRNHRKIYIFDNQTVFSGGMNIGDEYMSPMEHEGMWDDLLFKINGESIAYFLKIFSSDWHFATGEELEFEAPKAIKQEGFVQVIPSGPDLQQDQLYAGLLTAINSAKEKIWIITPYLIPSAELYQTIILAKRRGIDVKIITPKSSNHKIVDRARASYTRDFVACDIDVHFTENMMHAKAVLIDDNIAMLGSVNLDNRSLFLNYEIATFLYSKHHVQEVYNWANKLLADSTLKTDHMSNKRSSLIVESILKILTPLM